MAAFGGKGRGSYGGSLGWSVGLPEWLNNPNSKVNRYWRVIEEGSDRTDWPWQGRRVVGLWGPNAGPRGGLINGDLSAFQTGRGDQKFVPFFRSIDQADQRRAARAALYYFFGGGRGPNMELLDVDPGRVASRNRRQSAESNRKRIYFWLMTRARVEDMPFVQGVIIREVKAGHYYARALMTFDPMEHEVRAVREVFDFVLGGTDPRTSAGLRKMRGAVNDEMVARARAWGRRGQNAKPKTGPRRYEGNAIPQGLATMSSSYLVQDNIRTSRGTISQFTSELNDVNARVAAAFQAEVVQMMQQERRRPVSGALIKATADPRNRTPQGS